VNADGKIDFQEFRELNIQFPALVYPAFRLQRAIQQNTLGQAFWNELKHKNFLKSQKYYAHAMLKNKENYSKLEKVDGCYHFELLYRLPFERPPPPPYPSVHTQMNYGAKETAKAGPESIGGVQILSNREEGQNKYIRRKAGHDRNRNRRHGPKGRQKGRKTSPSS
jgi:hypothetical protein